MLDRSPHVCAQVAVKLHELMAGAEVVDRCEASLFGGADCGGQLPIYCGPMFLGYL